MDSYTRYEPRFNLLRDHAQIRVFGPQQQRNDDSHGYWAGAYNADELERLGVEAIQVAAELRRRAQKAKPPLAEKRADQFGVPYGGNEAQQL